MVGNETSMLLQLQELEEEKTLANLVFLSYSYQLELARLWHLIVAKH